MSSSQRQDLILLANGSLTAQESTLRQLRDDVFKLRASAAGHSTHLATVVAKHSEEKEQLQAAAAKARQAAANANADLLAVRDNLAAEQSRLAAAQTDVLGLRLQLLSSGSLVAEKENESRVASAASAAAQLPVTPAATAAARGTTAQLSSSEDTSVVEPHRATSDAATVQRLHAAANPGAVAPDDRPDGPSGWGADAAQASGRAPSTSDSDVALASGVHPSLDLLAQAIAAMTRSDSSAAAEPAVASADSDALQCLQLSPTPLRHPALGSRVWPAVESRVVLPPAESGPGAGLPQNSSSLNSSRAAVGYKRRRGADDDDDLPVSSSSDLACASLALGPAALGETAGEPAPATADGAAPEHGSESLTDCAKRPRPSPTA